MPAPSSRTATAYKICYDAKDGDWPPKDVPGALGNERPL